MSQQIQITGGAKVRNLEGVLTGTSGVVDALGINVPDGIPQLDGSGKILVSQLPNSVMEFKGTWNAATNTPTLVNGTGNAGDVYLVNVAGTHDFGDGPITFAVGDQVLYSGTTWERASGATGTVTSVAVTESGDALTITGSPITTSGTINIGFAGTSGQYVNGAGGLTTFPSLTGYVPYTGATADVDLGTFDLTADVITGATGSFASNGGSDTFDINHSSGSGIALNITKGGSGEGLYINKTSGSGNAATIVGTLEATTLVKTGGTSSQFLKADGSVDSNTYALDSLVVHLAGTETITGAKTFSSAIKSEVSLTSKSIGTTETPAPAGYVNIQTGGFTGYMTLALSNDTATRNLEFPISGGGKLSYELPSTSGILALTSDIPSVSGASGQVTYFNGTSSVIGSNNHYWDATNNRLGIGLTNPQRSLEIYSATADSHLRLTGNAPSVSMGEAVTGAVYQAKFGLATASGQYVSGAVAGDFVMLSQTGATIFATTATEKARITSGGLFLLGTTSSTGELLQVAGTAKFTGALSGTSATFSSSVQATNMSIGIAPQTDKLFVYNASGTNTGITIQQDGTGDIFRANGNSGANRFVVQQGGNVGIGTSSPIGGVFKLQVGDGSADSRAIIVSNQVYQLGFRNGASNPVFYEGSDTSGNKIFSNNAGSELMRITSGGLVGIGTSSPLTSLNSTLTVNGTGIFQTTEGAGSYNENLRLNRNPGNAYASIALGGAYNSTSGTGVGQWTFVGTPSALSYRLDFDYNGATKGYIDSSSGVYVVLSDKNKKKDFEDSTIGLNAVLGLKPTLFRMIDEDNLINKQLGFIAQEVKECIPQAYVETIDGFIGLQDRPIIAALVKGMQEMVSKYDVKIEEQQAQIEELSNKIVALESK